MSSSRIHFVANLQSSLLSQAQSSNFISFIFYAHVTLVFPYCFSVGIDSCNYFGDLSSVILFITQTQPIWVVLIDSTKDLCTYNWLFADDQVISLI